MKHGVVHVVFERRCFLGRLVPYPNLAVGLPFGVIQFLVLAEQLVNFIVGGGFAQSSDVQHFTVALVEISLVRGHGGGAGGVVEVEVCSGGIRMIKKIKFNNCRSHRVTPDVPSPYFFNTASATGRGDRGY